MPPVDPAVISRIRSAARELVRELGFMDETLADTSHGASAFHAIIEVGASRSGISSKDLSARLLLEKSTVSRLVNLLIHRGEIRERRSSDDGRIKLLHLSDKGRRSFGAITRFAEAQVAVAIQPLSHDQRQTILQGLASYASALTIARNNTVEPSDNTAPIIRTGYTPGLIGRITQMHAIYYNQLVGFDIIFETGVASGLCEFMGRLDSRRNSIWYVENQSGVVGSIAIDGQDLQKGQAHLRWFLIEPTLRGMGLGKSLMERAVRFCDEQDVSEIHLWTFKGLEAARSLYEHHGFILVNERAGSQWGNEVCEQLFIRR